MQFRRVTVLTGGIRVSSDSFFVWARSGGEWRRKGGVLFYFLFQKISVLVPSVKNRSAATLNWLIARQLRSSPLFLCRWLFALGK